jgi:hypothetical protein
MNKNFRMVSIGIGTGATPFLAMAMALFTLSKTPEEGWLPLGCGLVFLLAALAFWGMGRKTHLRTYPVDRFDL